MEEQRVLLLLPTHTYRADEFLAAAGRLGCAVTVASEIPSSLEAQHPADLLTIPLHDRDAAAAKVAEFARRHPLTAVLGPDDDTAVLAAVLACALGLPANPADAVEAARSKILQRERLSRQGLPVPAFAVHDIEEDSGPVASRAPYPCVLKPAALSASRGVIRADDPGQFRKAHVRLRSILESEAARGGDHRRYLVEAYVPGPEYAVEGLIVDGGLHILGVFDKPDPLEGPYFEETIYVTPSRSDSRVVNSLIDLTGRAAGALGLVTGPVHAELRFNGDGPWLIELAARPIGGKCSRVMRFGDGSEHSLEDVLLRHCLGVLGEVPPREPRAAGVMMIPIPRAGVLEEITGVDAARAEPGVEEVLITAHRGQELVPLPEGSRYLGFIFARGESPELVEGALRRAHDRLEIRIDAEQGAGSRERGAGRPPPSP